MVTPTFVDIAGGNPDPTLDGRSFRDIITGKKKEHKEFVFGEMTTKGIINGNASYPIRSVRSRTHKLILNLQHNQAFTNACTKSTEFQSIKEAAEQGDAAAQRVVARYQRRPAIEFYDVIEDPLEMHNLADHPEHAEKVAELRHQLDRWMKSQGDEGIATERLANHHKKGKSTQGKDAPASGSNSSKKKKRQRKQQTSS